MIKLVGIGPGDTCAMTVQAVDAVREADMVIGASRMLAALPVHTGREVSAYRPAEILSILERERPERPCILYSGDTGFWSGAETLIPLLREKGMDFRILPGLSCVQLLASRLGRSWKDWVLLSAHGQDEALLPRMKEGRSVFLLTDGADSPGKLCRTLVDAGLGRLTVTVGENLSYPDERITTGTATEFAGRTFAPLNAVLIASAPAITYRPPGIPDNDFFRGETPMTKQEVRAVILANLAVEPTDVCWDIGAGTGSVSVELALHGKEVWAVEYREDACDLIKKNREKFCAWNLHLIQARAPESLNGLPKPDKVFIGGSEGEIRTILRKAAEGDSALRVCVSAITLETVGEAVEEMEALDLEPEVVQIAVSRTRRAGGKHLLLAQNPVFLITGGRP